MIHDLDARRENVRLRLESERMRDVVLTLLEAPFEGMVPWARTFACGELGHPKRKADGLCYCDRSRVAGGGR